MCGRRDAAGDLHRGAGRVGRVDGRQTATGRRDGGRSHDADDAVPQRAGRGRHARRHAASVAVAARLRHRQSTWISTSSRPAADTPAEVRRHRRHRRR